mmetsp:Transcript_68222/g.120414  ORF Transcript_68222/g.120414 Transcript_68222/m.120414 type:complete len:943 (-) Transcript_68222:137-2965(-)|eukprot:CAMPEP_0197665196 /NCGR_PEP_ID=MMETSP1338-20131121/59086_1 /TAXON_ID=43686 ORGANISM="Pelagodinium beii, Strain RCC1491" /NCGR_SAMPLE_ID=MMETSP1338 /ASSEMBLY_ACC=CAM_ASM_000754 /LENGTH=942 /DNA_ID=CAMNT_0043243967 /DNA_START=46 /DNA_END=2874 /DNA_ORIENTATION=+
MATIRNDIFILSLRQQVIFPAMRTSVSVSPQTFSELCDFCEKHNRTHVGVLTADSSSEGGKELYTTGSWCRIASHAQSTTKVRDREVSVVTLSMEGQSRFKVEKFSQTAPFHVADIRLLDDRDGSDSVEVKALVQSVQQAVQELLSDGSHQGSEEAGSGAGLLKNLFGGSKRVRWPASPSVLADMIAAGLSQLSIPERQQVLDTVELKPRLELVLQLVKKVSEVQTLSREITSKMQKRTQDELRETVLKRQLADLQREMRKIRSGKSGDSTSTKAEGDGEEGEKSSEPEEEEEEEEEDDISALRETLKKAQLSAEAQKIAQRELRRLQNIQPHHPEYSVCRTYLETLASLPWAESSQDDLQLGTAHEILEKDHYGLEKVKRRILEFLAVQKMRGDMKGPILCLHGPPGVGKTSLGRSVAKALGRKFHRIALGGVRDEAELRGHRRTYIGSMPGAIMQALTTLKVNNPVILLDEIDKLTRNAMFNPSGAMLELLDPEQNHTFKDHYVNTPFDLSKVLFLCTCNDLQTIDRPLLDRMEVIDLSGYTVEEKVHIATTHLLPKQRILHALEKEVKKDEAASEDPVEGSTTMAGPEQPLLEMTPAAIQELITKWTAESGVRSLERRAAQVCRWAALRLAGANKEDSSAPESQRSEAQRLADAALAECGPNAEGKVIVDAQHLPHIVGAEIFEPDLAERLTVGVAMGLGVTATGGQLLFVEASRSKGSGRLTVTGQLGEVMKESVSTAMSLLRSKLYYAALEDGTGAASVVRLGSSGPSLAAARAGPLSPGLVGAESVPDSSQFKEVFADLIKSENALKDPFGGDDVHVHFPAGAIPKDGPSAGVATTLALASLLLNRPVRSDTAVTGEITLRGHVLPVGGVRDKVLAAHRAGIRHVLVPFGNQRHVQEDIPEAALADVDIHFVKHIDEALVWAFGDGSKQPFPRSKL